MTGGTHAVSCQTWLSAKAEALNERFIARLVFALQVVEQPAPRAHHLEQAPARVIVFVVQLENLLVLFVVFVEQKE